MGFLSRQFHLVGNPMPLSTSQIPCSPNPWLLLYSVWDPSTALYTDKLESLQDFATNVSSWNNDTPLMMIAWDSCICPDCPSAAWDTNFPFVTELWQADPLYLLVLFFTLYLCPHLHHNYTTWHLSCYCIAKCLVTTVAWLILLWNFMNAMLHGKDSCSGTDTWEKPY